MWCRSLQDLNVEDATVGNVHAKQKRENIPPHTPTQQGIHLGEVPTQASFLSVCPFDSGSHKRQGLHTV